ncbi:MAG: glycoside hydrolase family 130 protein [Bacilli bacterium]|nr:glycoside hydrolase family 130 protein [Bacilli bacterium]
MSKEQVFPYEECPEGFEGPIWRFSGNPVIKRHPTKKASRVFNSSVIQYGDGFIGIFRGDGNDDIPHLYVGCSKDGVNFDISDKRIIFEDEKGNILPETGYQYDPRLIPLEDKYYIVWCDDFCGPAISIAYTTDFKKFIKFDYPFLPCNRNGVLFPRKINGHYYMLSRPSDLGHTPFGDIFISESDDLIHWGRHKLVARSGYEWWCALKIGPGPTPIEIEDGWLLLTHGVNRTCNGYVYSIGGMILDKNDPSVVKYRCKDYLLTPEEDYETVGFVSNVIFPTSTIVDKESGRIAIYYGCADTYTGLAFSTIDRLVKFIKENAR